MFLRCVCGRSNLQKTCQKSRSILRQVVDAVDVSLGSMTHCLELQISTSYPSLRAPLKDWIGDAWKMFNHTDQGYSLRWVKNKKKLLNATKD